MYSRSLTDNQNKRGLRVSASLVNPIKADAEIISGNTSSYSIINDITTKSQIQGGLYVTCQITYEAYEIPYLEVDKPEVQWVTIWNPIDYHIISNTDWFVE